MGILVSMISVRGSGGVYFVTSEKYMSQGGQRLSWNRIVFWSSYPDSFTLLT